MRSSLCIAAGFMALGLAAPGGGGGASAAPILVRDGASSGVAAVLVYSSAADRSQVRILSEGGGGAVLFDNQRDPLGTTRSFAPGLSDPAFRLDNLTQGYSLHAATAEAPMGLRFARFATDFAAFGVGALPAAAMEALATLGNPPVLYYVGFEDRRRGDFDFNDLILAITSMPAVATPVVIAGPSGLALFVPALLGLGLGLGMTRPNRPARASSARSARA